MPNTTIEENKSEEVKKGPVQGPIRNLYTDKIIDKGALLEAVKAQFPITASSKPEKYISDLAGRHIAFSMYLGFVANNARTDQQKEVFAKVCTLNNYGDAGTYIPVTDGNWHYWRDIMRYGAWSQMICADEQRRISEAGESIYRAGSEHLNCIIYQRVPVSYALALLSKYKIVLDPGHFLHVSQKDQNFIRYTPDEKSRERDIVVETTISKYLRKYHPSLTDAQLQEIARIHKIQYGEEGVQFFTSAADIRRVYQNGPLSCMAHEDSYFKSPSHPTAAYAESPGIRLAVVEDTNGTYSARSFVYDNPNDPNDKRIIRVYGDSILSTKLMKQGYKNGTWEGVKLRKLPFLDKFGKALPNTFVLPYIDDAINGNGRSFSVQHAFTAPDLDYILITNKENAAKLVRDTPTGISVQAITTNGAWGTHLNYNAMRHNSYEIRSGAYTRSYRPPTATGTNEWKELYCSLCNEVYDDEYFKPVIISDHIKSFETKTKKSVCTSCIANARNFGMVRAPGFDQEVYILLDSLFARHKTNGDIYPASVFWGKSTAEKYDFIYEFQLKDFGYAILNPHYYGSSQFAKVENTASVNNEVFRLDDVVEDVYGQPSTKYHTYFLGQTADGKMQFFPSSSTVIREAMEAGKFYIVDGKLEYRDKQAFNPASRKEYFKVIGELEEEEDTVKAGFEQTISFDAALPFIDVLNVMSSAFMVIYSFQYNNTTIRDICLANLCRLFPRVNNTLLNALCIAYMSETSIDKFAGIEGIQSLGPQLTAAFLQGNILNGDTEIDENTREVFLTDQGLRRFVSQALPIFSSGTSTLFIKRRGAEKPTSIPPSPTGKKKRKVAISSNFNPYLSSTIVV